MRKTLALLIAFGIGFQPALVAAQSGRPAPPAGAGQKPADPPENAPLPSVESLGLSLDRIKRELREQPPSNSDSPLKLDFYVEVFALAPPIPIFQPGELSTGPVPWGAPTHADILNIVTPQAFKSPAIPVSSLAIMGIAYLIRTEAEREKRRKAEEERRRRNEELKKQYPYLVADPKK